MKFVIFLAIVFVIGVSADLKETLIHRAALIERNAKEALDFLAKHNREHEQQLIKKEMEALEKLVSQVKTITDTSRLRHAEVELAALEGRFLQELRRIHREQNENHFTTASSFVRRRRNAEDDRKARILSRAEMILKHAEAAVAELITANRKHEAEVLKKDDALLKKLIDELKATTTTDHSKLNHIEHEVIAAEARVQLELRRIHRHTPAPHHITTPTY